MHFYLVLKNNIRLYYDNDISDYDVVMLPRAFESWCWDLNALFSYERSDDYV